MSENKYLSGIKKPSDLKKLNIVELDSLCEEIREKLVETVSKNGGHLSPNLGTVELSVALNRSFSNKYDDIVWDVGHQSYTHKLLTGRTEKFETIRTEGGISGFPKREESEYDSFNTGHSSTSISAAYGIARAKELNGKPGYTVAVIGDGALTGGLAYEGLNNAGRSKKNFIVVLNDNNMSISKNVGSVAKYLTNMRINSGYLRIKRYIEKVLIRTPIIGKPLRRFLLRSKSRIRDMFYKNTIFDDLGFIYYGPVDGHNIQKLVNAFTAAKRVDQPVLVHVITQKGKGYKFAENDPGSFHGISKFDVDTGEPYSSKTGFSAEFGKYMVRKAEDDKHLCAITAAMASATGLSEFSQKYKNRFYDVGIAEEHAVTFSAGLAAAGALPVFVVYSTFLQRAYDQILHDAALQRLHIVLAVDRAGLVGEDGETHQGIFDVPFLNTIPNVTVYSPTYFDELTRDMDKALYETEAVAVVRYPRGGEQYRPDDFAMCKGSFDFYGDKNADILIVTYGRLFSYACKAYERLKSENIKVRILKLNRIKPFSNKAVESACKHKHVLFFEEGIRDGGVGERFISMLNSIGFKGTSHLKAIDDFVQQAPVSKLLEKLGLDDSGMVNTIKEFTEI